MRLPANLPWMNLLETQRCATLLIFFLVRVPQTLACTGIDAESIVAPPVDCWLSNAYACEVLTSWPLTSTPSVFSCKVVLVGSSINERDQMLFISTDEGSSFQRQSIAFTPDTLVFHPKEEDKLLAYCKEGRVGVATLTWKDRHASQMWAVTLSNARRFPCSSSSRTWPQHLLNRKLIPYILLIKSKPID